MTLSVKYLHDGLRGAPALSGTAGALLTLLRACLITGFGSTTPQSVTVSNGIATATLNAGETFEVGSIVLVSGGTPAALNGEARVLTSTPTQITWATSAADGATTGIISIRYAPVGGWEELFAGSHPTRMVLRSADVRGHGHCLWIDDSGTTTARVRGYVSMTGIATGTEPFPSDTQISGGGWWQKSAQASGASAGWTVYGDSAYFGIAMAAGVPLNATRVQAPLRGFGLPIAESALDAWSTIVNCAPNEAAAFNTGAMDQATAANTMFSPRAFSGAPGSVSMGCRAYVGGAASAVSGLDGLMGPLPDTVSGRLRLSAKYITDPGSSYPRAVIPGMSHVPHTNAVGALTHRQLLIGTGDLAGRSLRVIYSNANTATPPSTAYIIDTSGGWR